MAYWKNASRQISSGKSCCIHCFFKNTSNYCGGGVIYSDACSVLKKFVNRTGIPVVETFAGKGSLRYDEPENLGAAGVTGTPGAIAICERQMS